MARVRVKILNWDRYNEKRKDVKHPTWFRMENSFAQSQSLFGLNAVQRYVYFTLLGYAGERQSSDLDFEIEWFLHFHGAGAFNETEFLDALSSLNGKTIEIVLCERILCDTAAHVTDAARTRDEHGPLHNRHNITDITDETETKGPENPKTPAVPVTLPAELAELRPRLPPGAIASLFFQFSEEFLVRHLRDAIAYCDAKEGTVGKVVPLKTVQRYLRLERDKPPDPRKPTTPRSIAEMRKAGEL